MGCLVSSEKVSLLCHAVLKKPREPELEVGSMWRELEESLEVKDRWWTHSLLARWPSATSSQAHRLAHERGYRPPKPSPNLRALFAQRGSEFKTRFHNQTPLGGLLFLISLGVAWRLNRIASVFCFVADMLLCYLSQKPLKTSFFMDLELHIEHQLTPVNVGCQTRRWFPRLPTPSGLAYLISGWICEIVAYFFGERHDTLIETSMKINLTSPQR